MKNNKYMQCKGFKATFARSNTYVCIHFREVIIDVVLLLATYIEFHRVGPATENVLESFLFFIKGT